MSMAFKEIVDAVLADAFPEAKRASAKQWVVFRHAWLWDLEEWSFKYATVPVTFTAGSQAAETPADLRAAVALFDATGCKVRGISDVRRFFDAYNANLGLDAGTPEAYTIVNGQLLLSSLGDGTDGLLVYEKAKPTLNLDTDPTGLPDGYDLALVHGGKAEGFKLTNIPLSENFDADFTAAANTMRNAYLTPVREPGQQFGAYRPW